MKKALLIIGMIIIFFAGCKKDDILEASKVEMKDVTMERGWEHVKMSGEYSYPQALEGMKIIVSSNENMGESVEYVCALEGKKFDVTIDNLEAGVTYYYRYEYDNGYDKARGDKANFVTVGKPIVVTNNIVNVTKNSAVLNGSVTNNDVENKINVRGFCWSKNANPTISGSHNNNGSSSGTGTSSFTYNLSYLESNTKYYVRAYAKTDWGVVYGEEKSFVTMGEEPEIVLPTVTTNSVTNITSNSATCGGNVTSDGNGTVSARGICWSETSEPKINNLYSEESNEGTGTGSFTSSMTNLKANTTYYVRAYATNEAGTVYGEVKSFKTLEEEPEETISGTENGHNYVDLGLPSGLKWATCNVGASTSTDNGHYFAWGETTTKTEYTEDNSLTYGKQMNDISGNSQYDAATANWGGSWRMPKSTELKELIDNCTWTWTTQNGVNGYNVEGQNGNSIFLPADGYRYGSSLYHAGYYGYYWSSTPYEGGDYGAYDLYFYSSYSHNMSYYYRYYGQLVRPVFGGNFEGPDEEPIILPTVTTAEVTNITENSATCGGNVMSDGNGTVSARGICWSETSEPKINNLYSEESNEGTGTGSFTSSMTNLKANTTYYVRAYATNEAGTVYGEVKSFKTLEEEPEETISGTENGHNYVDLGLPSGLKWATCNVGASTSTDNGHYFAWGETTTKTEYTEDNSLTYDKQMNDISGNPQYDAATANWGGNWRMPTKAEQEELLNNCTWTWTRQNGVNGYNVEGPNGNSIFLPTAGYRDGSSLYHTGYYGFYWSSTPYEGDDYDAYDLYFYSSYSHNMIYNYRYYGQLVRPVFGGNFEGPDEEPEIVLPTVTTAEVTNITTNSATCGGNVMSDGNGTVSARGICWSETSEPKINNLYSEESNEGTGTGSFTSSMTNLKANTTYYVRAYATNEVGTAYGEERTFKTFAYSPATGTSNGYGYVDLGLSVKWATCNVGASKPEEYGNYYAWGEITTKETYDEDSCLTYGLSNSQLQTQGYIDSEGNLTAQYDAATANWGGGWRMPTKAEQEELLNNCTWTWTTYNGVKGYNVEGPNGNSIFFPAAGIRSESSLYYAGSEGDYWSSTPYYDYYVAYRLYFYSSDHSMEYGKYRFVGLSVRPVVE